jgi:hypothetical protein
MAAGRLDQEQVQQAAKVLLADRRHDLPSVSVAVAARLLSASRTTIESWLQAGVLTPAPARRRRHEVTTDSLVRLQVLLEELRRLGKNRKLRDYLWWSAQLLRFRRPAAPPLRPRAAFRARPARPRSWAVCHRHGPTQTAVNIPATDTSMRLLVRVLGAGTTNQSRVRHECQGSRSVITELKVLQYRGQVRLGDLDPR